MSNESLPEGDDLAADIVDVGEYEAARPPRKDFLPWHRPRKQFVRDKQWRDQILRLLDDAPREDGYLKYLGLPGVDLIDLRYFHAEICEARDLGLKFLGFNTALATSTTQTELNVSLDEVRRLKGVDQRSDVIGDDFVRIANPESVAWRRTLDLAPFDVLNLDLCGGFALPEGGVFEENHYNAVTQLLGLQARQKAPWLLFLTTLAGPQHINVDVLNKLVECYLANLKDCATFRVASEEHFRVTDEASLRARIGTEDGLLPFFACSLAKWLAGLAVAQKPPTKIEVKSVIGYRVCGEGVVEDLVSIAVRFTPTFLPVNDPMGIARNNLPEIDECAAATQIIRRVANRKNADTLLRDDAGLKGDMIEATARLLEDARYDAAAYREWVGADA